MAIKVGERVGALQAMNESKAYLFGFGVYQGEQEIGVHEMLGITKEELEALVDEARATDSLSENFEYTTTNPQILLDDGRIVWGYQCWWGSEEGIRAKIINKEIINV